MPSPRLLPLVPLPALKVTTHQIPAHAHTPNTSLQQKPLLIYHSVFPSSHNLTAASIESHLLAQGVVKPQWRYTMYSTSHFHSTTHEVLAISSGRAKLCFGHEDSPSRILQTVERGDVIVVPAGVAHRLWEDLSEGGEGFEMVGCYPTGFNWDMCYGDGRAGEDNKVLEEMIRGLSWFGRDPVYGERGPVLDV